MYQCNWFGALSRGGQFLNSVEQATGHYCGCALVEWEDTALVLNKELFVFLRKNCGFGFVLKVGSYFQREEFNRSENTEAREQHTLEIW